MRYRQLSSTGDYTFGTGNDFFQNSPAAVGQAVQTRLRLLTGEWFLDTSDGTPWLTSVLGKYSQANYDSLIKARILDTEGVSSIASYTSTLASRALAINVTINTIYGQAVLETTL